MLINLSRMRFEIETEDFSKVIELPAALLKLVRSMLGKEGASSSDCEERDVKSISRAVGRDESTVRKHLFSFRGDGACKGEKRKPLIVRATKLADIATETHKP